MQLQTAQLLLNLNKRFYSDFGRAFAATRRRVQPGIRRAVTLLAERRSFAGRWLDLGCGSGELARYLEREGFTGSYLGLDGSAELLTEAGENLPARPGFRAAYRQADLAGLQWTAGLAPAEWQIVSCFAVLHHLPGAELRAALLRQVRRLLASGGTLLLSVWQFQHSPRLLARRQPWASAGLSESDVEDGDTLLDWRYALPGQPEQTGLRYVHLFSPAELAELASACGFAIEQEYASDGEGGRLGLYQVWRFL